MITAKPSQMHTTSSFRPTIERAGLANPTYRHARAEFDIPAEISAQLRELARRESVSQFITLLSGFQTMLYRYADEEDVVIGIESFGNRVLLITSLAGNPTFTELLHRVRDGVAAAPRQESCRGSKFRHMFILHSGELGDVRQTSADLTVTMSDGQPELRGVVDYNADLFDSESVSRMARHFQVLLAAIVSRPSERIDALPLLTKTERHRILVEWNDTTTDFPHNRCIHELIEEQAERAPDATAVVFGAQRLSYRELNRRANCLAHHLRTLGVGPEVLVGISMECSLEMIVGLLGILKAGGAYVPLDPSYPKERLEFMLQDAGAPVLVTQEKLLGIFPAHSARVVCLDRDGPIISQQSDVTPASDVTAGNLVYVIYTSGSTGRPKGVLLEHRGLCNTILALIQRYDVHADSRYLLFGSLSFDASAADIFSTLVAGSALHLAGTNERLSQSGLINLLRGQAISHVVLPPSLVAILPVVDLPHLRCLVTAGETCSSEIVRRWAPGRRFVNAYGPTEATICATTAICSDVDNAPPIGRPINNTRVYLLDRHMEPVPVGVPGEVYIAGIGLARGYHNRPDLTAASFLPDPFSTEPDARLYKTGDLARYTTKGNLVFLGRVDDQVKIRGFRIELGEIESVLRQQDGVQEALVMAREDVDGDKRVVAYLIAGSAAAPTERQLRAWVREGLPDYMMPSNFVFLKSFPLTPNGKVDRKALPAPQAVYNQRPSDFVAPRSPLEQQLAKLWEKILGVKQIGVRDNFFELGGHSLLAVRLFAQVEKLTGKNLPLVTLIQAPTIEQLAEILHQEGWESPWASLVPIKADGSKLPFYCVHGVGGNILEYLDLAKYLEADQPFYGLQAIGLDGKRPVENLTVEQMATRYIEEIREFQSQGPYYLGGSSFGGLVAYEMAQQLRAAGEEVRLLALFDTNAPGYPRFLPTMTAWRRKLDHWCDRVELHWGNLCASSGRQKLAYIREKLQRWRKQLRWKRQHLWDQFRELAGRVFWPVAIKQARAVGYRAATVYTPRPYAGPLTLFRATERPRGIYPDLTLGWQPLAQGGLTIYDTPGYHGAIVREPRAGVLAGQLTDALRNARAVTSTSRGLKADESMTFPWRGRRRAAFWNWARRLSSPSRTALWNRGRA